MSLIFTLNGISLPDLIRTKLANHLVRLARVEELRAFLRRIAVPVLFVEGAQTLYFMLFNGKYSREEFLERMTLVPDFRRETIEQAGHMLHHDQPVELAQHIAAFLN